MTKRKLSLRLVAATAVVALAAIGAGTASAHGQSKYAQGCPYFDTTQAFLPWLDPGYYFVGPGGDFETTLTGWTAKGSPKIVSGNETFLVGSPTDSHALSLPKNAGVTSPSICVSLDTPDLRMFVKNTGTTSATLQINMTYTNNSGRKYTVSVGKVLMPAKADWTPTIPVLFLANITSILSSNNQTWVTFTLSSTGSLFVDDFYVDPIKHH
jgi:hypothetical protein